MQQLRHISIAKLTAEAGGNPWTINKSLQSGCPAQISDLAQAFRNAGRYTTESSAAFDEAGRRFAAAWNREAGDHPINGSAQVRRTARSLQAQSIQLPKIGSALDNIAAALAEVQRTGALLVAALEAELPHLDNQLGEALDLENDMLIAALEQQAIDGTRSAMARLTSMRSGYSDFLQEFPVHAPRR